MREEGVLLLREVVSADDFSSRVLAVAGLGGVNQKRELI